MNATTKILGIAAFFAAGLDFPAERDYGRECLALAAYSEARSDGDAGMLAVMRVVLNRASDPAHRWPSSICAVVTQRGQFVGVERWHYPRVPHEPALWDRALALTDEALAGNGLPDRCSEATNFHQSEAPSGVASCRIASHSFYNESAAVAANR